MKIICTSTLGTIKTVDNKLVAQPFENANGFVDKLKECVDKTKKIIFISNRWDSVTNLNQPKDEVFNDYHYSNTEYANVLKNSFKLTGMNFEQMVIVDCEYKEKLEDDIKDCQLIYIQGGHTPRGLKILKQLDFVNCIDGYEGVILFTGTAAKLPASKVLSTHHGNMDEYEIEEGLGLREYSIRPHFRYSFKDYLFNKKYRNRIKLLKNFSKDIDVYAIDLDAYIFDNGINMQIFGKCYKFTNGEIKKFKN